MDKLMPVIFLTYINRSGSTFLASELNKSPEICSCPEAQILVDSLLVKPNQTLKRKVAQKILKSFSSNPNYKEWRKIKIDFSSLEPSMTNISFFHTLLNQYKSITKPKAIHVLFKAERLIELFGLFPNEHWIILIRDCRAVYNSQKHTNWPGTNKKMSTNPIRTAMFWKTFIQRSEKCFSNKSALVVKYENLIVNHESSLNHLVDHLNISMVTREISDNQFFNRLSKANQEIHKNIILAPCIDHVNKWESYLSKKEIDKIEYICGGMMIQVGYNKKGDNLVVSQKVFVQLLIIANNFRRLIKKIYFKCLSII